MRTYEELSGATGRRAFYRAERFAAREVFPRFVPRVLISGAAFNLENLSMSGLAASTARGRSPAVLEQGQDVGLILEGEGGPLFSGNATLHRVDTRADEMRVALSFKGASLDIPALVNRHNETLIQRELNGGLSHALELVPSEYRRFCADVLHLLRAYRNTLARFDGLSKGEGEASDRARTDTIYHAAEERLLREWRALWLEGNALVRPLIDKPDALAAVKAFTEQVLTPEFMGGAIWNRSYSKPLGYPGDFQMMNYVYQWQSRGANVYERLVHRIGLDVAECIATRMVMVQHEIASVVASGAGSDKPARVLSLGCGPAQEVLNYLEIKSLPRDIDVTLVDQDHSALDYAYQRVFPQTMRHGGASRLNCLQVSFIELMKAGEIFKTLPPQDLIYTVGLVDYLSIRRIQRLVSSLYRKLAPGGRLVVGNMADVPGSNFWPMECLCDWNLHYRTEEQMLEMAATLPAGSQAEIRPDPTGRVFMLYITKAVSA